VSWVAAGWGQVYRAYDTEPDSEVATEGDTRDSAEDDEFQATEFRAARASRRASMTRTSADPRSARSMVGLYVDMRPDPGPRLSTLIAANGGRLSVSVRSR